jgi:uncharacterized repeat protein (TIGR03803 family)
MCRPFVFLIACPALCAIVTVTIPLRSADVASYDVHFEFNGKNRGGLPSDTLLLDSKENLYGTTQYSTACGTLFRRTPAGSLKNIYIFKSLADQDGCSPQGGVFQDQAGNLYGTTFKGGTDFNDDGTVYKVTLGAPRRSCTALPAYPTERFPPEI